MWLYHPDPRKLPKQIHSLEDIPHLESKIGFVYRITAPSGKIYIGRKVLYHKQRKKISVREKKQTGTRKKFKDTIKESNWKEYWGSCEELLHDIRVHGPDKFKREILEFACSSKQLSYKEIKWQFSEGVLEKESYNGNIAGKFYRRDIIDC